MPKPRPVSQLLSTGPKSSLQQTLDHGKSLYRLEQGLLSILPGDLARHTRLANLQGGELTLAVTSSVWANRLRYLQPQLIRQLRSHRPFQRLKSIQIIISPERRQFRRVRPPLQLSRESAEIIASAAETISDEGLSSALRRLSLHAKGRQQDP